MTITQPINTSDDDPLGRYTQQPAGATQFYWIDAPGYARDSGGGPQNLYLVQNFTSWAQQGNSICKATWHNKLVVTNGTTQSYFGTGLISTTQ